MTSRHRTDFGPVQLARWLGIEEWQLRRALNRGLIPAPDIEDRRWSAELARTLPDRVPEILTALGGHHDAATASMEPEPDPEPEPEREPTRAPSPGPKPNRTRSGTREGLGPVQLARYLGLKNWQLQRARDRDLIPAPDTPEHRWSAELARTLPDRVPEILAAVGDHPGLGSEKAAERLSERTGLEVDRSDVQLLSDRGLLRPVGDFRGWPLYSMEDLDALPHSTVSAIVDERLAWLAHSVSSAEAAELLGWSAGRFEVTAERHGLSPGRFDRFARAEVLRLSDVDSEGSGV
ncbi:hypothetical protein J7F01_08955 [Streptomyces sp. ISL-22]|uniref:hypothetical protein n=1 Tax=unclassified Streptomyces TaxID=2593676 RepID=UPI001BE9EFEB|nr:MULTISPECIES: hypothetical protein [unclassified Streptomyces]MBT2417994.1 hypothetical protein [Streptomyces sp. ISL-24]MBT2432331.1 hypothetical protein [Streptomyces sp. ISL-22]